MESNKKNAIDFYDLMFNKNRPREALEKHVGDEYIQHNPHFGDGKEEFTAYFWPHGGGISRQISPVRAYLR